MLFTQHAVPASVELPEAAAYKRHSTLRVSLQHLLGPTGMLQAPAGTAFTAKAAVRAAMGRCPLSVLRARTLSPSKEKPLSKAVSIVNKFWKSFNVTWAKSDTATSR